MVITGQMVENNEYNISTCFSVKMWTNTKCQNIPYFNIDSTMLAEVSYFGIRLFKLCKKRSKVSNGRKNTHMIKCKIVCPSACYHVCR